MKLTWERVAGHSVETNPNTYYMKRQGRVESHSNVDLHARNRVQAGNTASSAIRGCTVGGAMVETEHLSRSAAPYAR